MEKPLDLGTRLGPYEIVGPLGAGGMGLVVRAVDTRLGREVAIKVLYADAAKDEKRLRRLVGEARAASALNHPNILTVYEMGESPRGPYIVTELVEGQTVRALLQGGALPLSLSLDIATQTLTGLAKAHEIGLVHRDLKPENLMVSADGFVKILDFGVAKLARPDTDDPRARRLLSLGVSATEQGMVVGTAAYMSPEQVRNEPLAATSDLFSVAVVLYELVTGRSPFLRPTAADTLTAILRDTPEPVAGAPAALVEILEKGLQKEPGARFASARAMEARLRALRRDVETASGDDLPTLHMQTPDRVPEAPRGGRQRGSGEARPVRRVGAAALALAVLGAGALLLRSRSASAIDSIAVLPFASADAEAEYLSDGMTESLTNSLSRVPGLNVVPRTVAIGFRGREADPRAVGKQLKVGALLTGRVSRREDRLLVQTELIEVAGGRQLWGEQYDERLSGVLEVQDAIATQITERLRGRLTGEQKDLVTRHATRNTEAYQLYLKGRYSWGKATEDGVRKAIEYFEQSIAKDPGYALAHAGLADSKVTLGSFGLVPPRETAPGAAAAAQKALSLDPNLAEAHTSLGFVKFAYEWNWAEAESEFRRAIVLDPRYPTAQHGLGLLLLSRGRFEESRRALRRAQELDPVSLVISADLGLPDLFEGRNDLAIRQFRSTIALDPTFARGHVYLALALAQASSPLEAVAEFEKGHELGGMRPETILVRAYAAAVSGRKPEALKIMEEFEALSSRRGVSPYHAAILYAFIDEKEDALTWLEKGLQERSPDMVYVGIHPVLRRLQGDPRFDELVRRIGPAQPPPSSF